MVELSTLSMWEDLRGILNIYITVYHNYRNEFWKIPAVYKQVHNQQIALILEHKNTSTCFGYCW